MVKQRQHKRTVKGLALVVMTTAAVIPLPVAQATPQAQSAPPARLTAAGGNIFDRAEDTLHQQGDVLAIVGGGVQRKLDVDDVMMRLVELDRVHLMLTYCCCWLRALIGGSGSIYRPWCG